PKPSASPSNNHPKDLTTLQSSMRSSLDGALYRWINEALYKSDSSHAYSMMKEDPNIFHEYHKGFRHQVESWPSNPASYYVSVLSSYPSRTVIADLGCGDAAIARSLIPKGFTVLSFDLVSDDTFVVEADIFGRLPLPGSQDSVSGNELHEDQGQIVDVVICALSLMGTNWPNCIREAWRVLRMGGELKIAEVASRFTDMDAFKSLISSIGFKLKSTDDRNTHFTLFEYKKVARRARSQKEWGKLLSEGRMLKPCEYKRR
ncbi:methyltransferase-domain-containing protein, partial [Vararia minispora EC-137]